MRRSDQPELLIEVARLYYYQHLTQEQVGEALGISRQKVSRLLNRAYEEGIVQIKIAEPSSPLSQVEEKLCQKFGLKEVKIARLFIKEEGLTIKRIAQEAAYFLVNKLEPYTTLGVAYGKTLYEMTHFLSKRFVPGLRVIQIMGGYGKLKGEVMSIELAQRIADAFEGDVVFLLAPAFCRDAKTKRAIEGEERIRRVLDLAKKVDIALVGIGGIDPSSTLMDTGDIQEGEKEELLAQGAVGNICGNFYNYLGEPISSKSDERKIGLTITDLRKISEVVGVAGGEKKLLAILGALRGKLITTLITDELTAEWLL
ncbi:MAG: sugar-binding transcriptional regulator, partial [Candidatus Caldatribacteriaceae bacterium]